MAERTSSSRGLTIGLGVLVAAVVLYFFMHSSGQAKTEVRVALATHANVESKISTNGKVEPVEDYQAHASGPGIVARVFVDVGEHVEKGAELLKMEDSDARSKLATAQASLDAANASLSNMKHGGSSDELLSSNSDMASARSQLQQAQNTLTATRALQARGSASANEVASAQQRVVEAQARASQLEARRTGRYGSGDMQAQVAQVAQARAAVAAAQSGYAGVDVRAPFAGTVYSVPVSDYDFVQFGEALLNMADLTHIQIRAYFDEPEIGKLEVGQPVKIEWAAKSNVVWHGHVSQAPTTVITYGTRNVGECVITVDDAKGDLLPNTNVTVTVVTSQKMNVLTIPREALHTDGASNFVYRLVNDELKKTSVQVGSVNLTKVEITSGLKDGDSVALNSVNNSDLRDGLKVKAVQ